MVAVPSQPDLREPLAKALCVRLPALDLLPSTSVAVCCWLTQHPDPIAEIDAGHSVVVVTPVGFFPALFTLEDAHRAAAEAQIHAVAIDLAPLLAGVRRHLAEQN